MTIVNRLRLLFPVGHGGFAADTIMRRAGGHFWPMIPLLYQ